MRRTIETLALVLAIALVLATGASAATVRGSSRGVSASMHVGTHHPKVGKLWPVQFTVTRAGRAARAAVSYEYLYGGSVVGRASHYTFTGHFSDTLSFPARAVGYPLTFRAVITSGGATVNLDYAISVVR